MEVDYSKYTLEELYQALDSIDQNLHPQRVEQIHHAISKIKNSESYIKEQYAEKHNEIKQIKKNKITFEKLYKHRIILSLTSMLFGGFFLISIITKFNISNATIYITVNYPWLNLESKGHAFLIFMAYYIYVSMILGSLFCFIKKYERLLIRILTITWGLIAFGFQIWEFIWYVETNLDFGFQLSFPIIVEFAFRINFISTAFFVWCLYLDSDYRYRIFRL